MALTDNLSAFYEFESGALTTDATANGLTLTNTNSITSVSGKVGNAASLTAASSMKFSRANNALLKPGPDMSLQVWFYATVISGIQAFVTNDPGAIGPYFNGTSLHFDTFDSSAGSSSNDVLSLSATTWYHIIVTYDSADKKTRIYVNGSLNSTSGALTNGIKTNSTAALSIGEISGVYFGGLFDQFGFWQRVLTSGEITQLYNSGNGLSYAAMQSGVSIPVVMHHRKLMAA